METSASGSLAGTPVWRTEQNPCYWMKRPSPRFGMVSSTTLGAIKQKERKFHSESGKTCRNRDLEGFCVPTFRPSQASVFWEAATPPKRAVFRRRNRTHHEDLYGARSLLIPCVRHRGGPVGAGHSAPLQSSERETSSSS